MTDSPTLVAGTQVGSYVLERRLGAGGMGEVWLGRHAVSGGLGAVKVLPHNARDAPLILRYFRREALAISRLRHPHVVALFEIGASHLVYQFVDGQDLARRLRSPIEPRHALRLARQVASALAHAHAHGLVHRDVKPGNILLDRAGNALLADFGLALADDEGQGQGAGTPAYAAPEQWSGAPVTAVADLYALGRTLGEMLAGAPLPADPERALAAIPATLPAALRAAIARATAPDPAARYPSAAAFEADLARVDLVDHAAPRRLAPSRRPAAGYAFLAGAERRLEPAPEIHRADFRVGTLAAAGLLDARAAERFLADSLYDELGFSLHAAESRLGPLHDPAALARASELVVLLHGWAATREVWDNVAAALCRDNAELVVLVPDFWGFGASPLRGALRAEHMALADALATVRRLLALLGLEGWPTVLVGHSLTATALLSATDDELGPATARVAINPVLPAYSAVYRRRVRTGLLLARTLGRIPAVHRWLLKKMLDAAPSVRELTAEVRGRMLSDALAAEPALFSITFRAVLGAPRLGPGPHHQALLLLGANDPLIAEDALAAALADLRLSSAQLVRLATGGHYPHLESAAHPEWTARNVAEIVHWIAHMLLSAGQTQRSVLPVAPTLAGQAPAASTFHAPADPVSPTLADPSQAHGAPTLYAPAHPTAPTLVDPSLAPLDPERRAGGAPAPRRPHPDEPADAVAATPVAPRRRGP